MTTRYTCCGCDLDMTNEVLRAMFSQGGIEVRDRSQARARPQPVMLTCPNGHTCRYEPPVPSPRRGDGS
jgi:hypothetical protein